jgi:hypothetical protein
MESRRRQIVPARNVLQTLQRQTRPKHSGGLVVQQGIALARRTRAAISTVPSADHERKDKTMTVSLAPIISLIAGVLILVMPRLLNYIVALYLIVIGLLGLFGGHIRVIS